MPRSIRLASAAGIGLFIAFVGLQVRQEIGLVGPDSSTLVTVTASTSTDPETDAGSIVMGSVLGVSPIATHVESSTGIIAGGLPGLTAVIVGLCFFTPLFFTPLLSSVPAWTIGPSSIMVCVKMMKVVKDIKNCIKQLL